jgi:hypothetical protein
MAIAQAVADKQVDEENDITTTHANIAKWTITLPNHVERYRTLNAVEICPGMPPGYAATVV